MRLRSFVTALSASVCLAAQVFAYEPDTHREIAELAALPPRSSLDSVLRAELGFAEGVRLTLLGQTVQQLLGAGAASEDDPALRSFNHFHNPLIDPWDDAGLSVGSGLLARGTSSVLWQQRLEQDAASIRVGVPLRVGGGNWSWQDARRRYLDALTGTDRGGRLNSLPSGREQTLVEVFLGLGHVMHMVQDATVPAHVRNDPHPDFLPFQEDGYEKWVDRVRTQEDRRAEFDALLDLPSVRPSSGIFTLTGNGRAPVPIARLIDTDRFDGLNFGVLTDIDLGAAEYTNGNFLSRDTIFRDFALPRRSSLEPTAFAEPEGARFRTYFSKVSEGEAVGHFVAVGALHRSLREALQVDVTAVRAGGWVLENRVHADYAARLIPRAVGFSAALLDYFFRGKLDVTIEAGIVPEAPGLLRLTGRNASLDPPDRLEGGTLVIYGDDLGGNRQLVAGPITLGIVDPGAELQAADGQPILFTPSFPPDRFVVVYKGKLGNEVPVPNADPAQDFPGGVIGKVLGGLRAESIFPEGNQRKLRAVEGVFPLPAAADGLEAIQWGDLDNTFVGLVAAAPAAAAPDQVRVLKINRSPGSPPVPLAGDFVDASLLKSLTFPFGIELPVTLDYALIHHSRALLITVDVTETFVWTVPPKPEGPFYKRQPPTVKMQSEVASDQVSPFTQRLPIVLDQTHLLGPESDPRPYGWRVVEVSLDAQQRPLALVEVQLTLVPGVNEVLFPVPVIDDKGNRSLAPLLPVSIRFPVDALLWALVDLERGEVLGVTSASTVSPIIVAEHRAAATYLHLKTIFTGGGTNDGESESWSRLSDVFAPPDFTPVELGSVSIPPGGVQDLAVRGWYREDLDRLVETEVQTTATLSEGFNNVYVDFEAQKVYQIGTTTTTFSTSTYFTFLRQGMRSRPTPEGSPPEVLLLFGTPVGVIAGEGEEARLVRWSPQVPLNTALAVPGELPPSNYTLQFATPRAGLVRAMDTFGNVSSLLFDFPTGALTTFPNQDLGQEYVLLAPEFLYNIVDTQFHTVDETLQRTALPRPLASAPVVPAPQAAYHLIRLP